MASEVSKAPSARKMKWDWVPNERIGSISFETPLADYVEALGLRFVADDDEFGVSQVHYEVPGAGVEVYVEDDRVDWVRCSGSIEFQGSELIGVTEAALEKLLGRGPDDREAFDLSEDDDETSFEALDYYALGLQVWMEDGRVESVSCSRDDEDS